MNRKFIGVMLGVIIIILSFIIVISLTDTIVETNNDQEGVTIDEIMDEIDNSLLDENGEIEIGEMV